MFYHTGKKKESQKKFVLPKEMSPLLPPHRKNLYLEQSLQIRPSEKQKIPDHTVKQQFVLEEKHDFSHSPIYIVGEWGL